MVLIKPKSLYGSISPVAYSDLLLIEILQVLFSPTRVRLVENGMDHVTNQFLISLSIPYLLSQKTAQNVSIESFIDPVSFDLNSIKFQVLQSLSRSHHLGCLCISLRGNIILWFDVIDGVTPWVVVIDGVIFWVDVWNGIITFNAKLLLMAVKLLLLQIYLRPFFDLRPQEQHFVQLCFALYLS